MDPDPWHLVHAGEFVFVIRLVLVKDDGKIEGIVNLLYAARFKDRKLIWSGDVGDVFNVPRMRKGLCAVVARRVLCGE